MRATHLTAAHLARLLAAGPPVVRWMGLSLPMAQAASRHAPTLRARAYDRVRRHGSLLPAAVADTAQAFGLAAPATRLALPPLATFAGGHDADSLVQLARLLDAAATDTGLDRLDGFSTSPLASPTDRAALAALPLVLDQTTHLHAALACDAEQPPSYHAALSSAFDAAHATRLAFTGNARTAPPDGDARVDVWLSCTDALARVPATDPASFARAVETLMAGLGRVGALLAERGARELSRRAGLPVQPGTVVLDAEVPAGWNPAGWGALATLRLVDGAAARGARRADARSHLTLRAAPGTALPLEIALVADGTYVLPSLPPTTLPADLGAVCAATGHTVTLRFAPPRA